MKEKAAATKEKADGIRGKAEDMKEKQEIAKEKPEGMKEKAGAIKEKAETPKEKPKKGPAPKAAESKKPVYAIGKRKKAVAWASVRPGTGIVTFNSRPLEAVENDSMKLLLREPLIIAGDAWKGLNISVKTKGGGFMGQAQAARQAVARGLAAVLGAGMKKAFMEYDRNLMVYDPRRTETHKPPRSSQGPRRYKQRSKR